MQKQLAKRMVLSFFVLCVLLMLVPFAAFAASKAGNATLQDGAIYIEWSGDSNSSTGEASGTTATFKAQSSSSKAYSNTVYIYNKSGGSAVLSFDFSISLYSGVTTKGSCSLSNESSPFSITLGNNEYYQITLSGAKAALVKDTTLTLTNISLETLNSTEVTINYDSNLGDVSIDGTTVSSGAATEIDPGSYTISANPKSGAVFLGWCTTDGDLLYKDATYPAGAIQGDISMQAVFASSGTAWLLAGGTRLYNDLNAAASYAASANTKTVILMNDGTLPAGNYTIPANVTLLVPFDSANTLYTSEPGYVDSFSTPKAYRTLTLAEGAEITVNGAISVSGKHADANGNQTDGAVPTGAQGWVKMNDGSSIVVNSGAALYAWGYITGSGSVTINSGGKVYEMFQIADYHGGSNTSDMMGQDEAVFPISQYYIQNIEVPMTLYAGALEYCYTTVYAKGDRSSSINFIGTSSASSMFQLGSGYMTKEYDGTTDRMLIDVYGDINWSSIKIALGDWGVSVDSSDYVLPLNGNMTITLHSGTANVYQDIALVPGVQLNILKDAVFNVTEGYSMYVYDLDNWDAYCGFDISAAKFIPVIYAPGRSYNRTEADLTDAMIKLDGTLNATAGHIYTTGGGANIYSTGTGKANITAGENTVTYQYKPDTVNGGASYVGIPITSAKLLNAYYDEENNLPLYTITAGSSNTTYNYSAEHGRWDVADENGNSHIITSEVKDATCDSAGYTTYTCSCGYSYADNFTAPHSNENCEHNLDNLFGIYGTSVRAGDSLGMYFYVKKEDLPNANGSKTTSGTYYAKVIHAKADGTTETVTDIEGELYQDTYYRFYFTGVAAKEMADMVYVSIYDNNDTLVSNVYSESVENYAVSLLEAIGKNPSGTNALLQQTLVDMLYYGAACQTYFGYNTDELATRNISTYTPSSGTISYGEDISNDDTVKAYCLDQSVTVESSLIFSFYFQNIDRTKGIDVSFTDHYGSGKSPEITVTDLGENKYRVDVHGLAVADGYAGNATISCKVTTSDGTEITAKGRISDYAKAAAEAFPDQKDVFERLMYFAASAYEYLHEVIQSA